MSLGTYIRPLEGELYRSVDRVYGEKTIAKGLNALEVAALIESKFRAFSDPVALGLDASRFDRSVSEPVLRMVHDLCAQQYNMAEEMTHLLEMQINNRCKLVAQDGLIRYKVEAGIMSGDVDTSLKGCVIMCALVKAWSDHVGVAIRLVDNGDDCVVFMERSDLHRYVHGMAEWFAELGFDLTAEQPVDVLEHIEFCQSHPVVCSTGRYIMCRNPVTATTKDSMTIVDIRALGDYQKWLSAVSQCGQALAGDMPVFSALYGRYAEWSGTVVERNRSAYVKGGLAWQARGLERRSGVTDATRFSFWLAYGIPPCAQREIEHHYNTMLDGPLQNDPSEIEPQTRFQAPHTISGLSTPWRGATAIGGVR
jgi:hypothetical protein